MAANLLCCHQSFLFADTSPTLASPLQGGAIGRGGPADVSTHMVNADCLHDPKKSPTGQSLTSTVAQAAALLQVIPAVCTSGPTSDQRKG